MDMSKTVSATNGAGATSSPTAAEYLTVSIRSCAQGIANQLVGHKSLLNGRQCQDLASKLVKTVENVQILVSRSHGECESIETLRPALENLHTILEKARFLINGCSEADCRTLVFQMQNEEAFREILFEVGLCYCAIYEQAKYMLESEGRILGVEDLRESSSTFLPALDSVVHEDQQTLERVLENLVKSPSNDTKIQCLAEYLLQILKLISESRGRRIALLEMSDSLMWVTKPETQGAWHIKEFIGSGSGARGVLEVEWLGIPCAKKIFEAGFPENQDIFCNLAAAVIPSVECFGIRSIKDESYKHLEDLTFRKEVSLLARLDHPNVVKFLCCGRSDSKNEYFIGMELMEMDLSDLVYKKREGKLFANEVALDIILQIARGMLYLHDLGIAHRDLKPLNVVISKDPNSPHLAEKFCVKLIDFGLSKAKVQASMSSTVSILDCGTITYRAPEVFSVAYEHVLDGDKQKVNWFKADVYSFALTCSVILSLKKPFEGRHLEAGEEDKRYKELMDGQRPKLPSSCPKELAALLKECWETNPERRPHFSTICARLEKYKHGLLKSLPDSIDEGLEEVKYNATSNCNTYIERIFKERSRHRSSVKDIATNSTIDEAEAIVKAISFIPYCVCRGFLLNGWQLSLNMSTWIKSIYSSIVPGASFSPPAIDYLKLSIECVQDVQEVQRVNHETLLNGRQCQDLALKLDKFVVNIQKLVSHFRAYKNIELLRSTLRNICRILEKARQLVKQCGEEDWCRASVLQMQNEGAFQEILQEIQLYYNFIYEQAEGIVPGQILRVEYLHESSAIFPAPEWEVFEDQKTLRRRLDELDKSHIGSSDEQLLARFLLRKLKWDSQRDIEDLVMMTSETESQSTWEVTGLLGSGSTATVVATNWFGIPCARKEYSNFDNIYNFVRHEAAILARLHHPNIVKFFCWDELSREGRSFIGMELMEMSLSDLIHKRSNEKKLFPILVALDIILQIVRGMCYLHNAGIAHRDVKPPNVLINTALRPTDLDSFLQVKLIDFGLSKTKVQASKSSTISTIGVGTTRYRAPEVHPRARIQKVGWFKADVYSFALSCSEILSLKTPFQDVSIRNLYELIQEGLRPELPSDCPEELVALLKECWDANPKLRPDFTTIRTRLEKILFRSLMVHNR